VTLTLKHHASQLWLDDAYSRWLRAVQAHNRVTVGYIRAYEHDPQRHIHAVLVSTVPLDLDHAALIWTELISRRCPGAAEIEPYRYDVDGLAYVMKSLYSAREDIQFSRNLAGFSSNSANRFFGKSAAERRQVRRIRNQRG
jgi:hypothetical protein